MHIHSAKLISVCDKMKDWPCAPPDSRKKQQKNKKVKLETDVKQECTDTEQEGDETEPTGQTTAEQVGNANRKRNRHGHTPLSNRLNIDAPAHHHFADLLADSWKRLMFAFSPKTLSQPGMLENIVREMDGIISGYEAFVQDCAERAEGDEFPKQFVEILKSVSVVLDPQRI